MSGDPGTRILKDVSRSFFLSLRLLPVPMRGAASLGYLLARTSDTLADTATAPLAARLAALESFRHAVATMSDPPRWPDGLLDHLTDPRERRLLEHACPLLAWLRVLPAGEAALVREVVASICGGQQLDLKRFATATPQQPVALPDDAALEDYVWRVAGCVGEFWTKLGFLTLGARFSRCTPPDLLDRGRAYGNGLQLVNILRDLPADLRTGRCYLPVADPTDRAALLACHARWLERAAPWIEQGRCYALTLPSRRLRAATQLPALLATETLARLRGATWETLSTHLKVPRRRVYALLLRAFF
ncbi:MAG: squalene/phytoene synthase family protein [Verrucomicrobia bacterium]|nr:squalene/phytoene synthase family protein [Verrucomicrobiota bacterium]